MTTLNTMRNVVDGMYSLEGTSGSFLPTKNVLPFLYFAKLYGFLLGLLKAFFDEPKDISHIISWEQF